jgi:hypothetical protein
LLGDRGETERALQITKVGAAFLQQDFIAACCQYRTAETAGKQLAGGGFQCIRLFAATFWTDSALNRLRTMRALLRRK